jgi:hypothetical protein
VEEQVSQLDMNRGAENWEEQLTDAGDKYFYNVVTGESSWTAPV